MPAVTLSVKKVRCRIILEQALLERKQMLIKYSNVYQTKDIKPDIGVNKYGLYPVLYGSYATFAEADKAKKIQKRTIQKLGFW
jgi:hypothetical protein